MPNEPALCSEIFKISRTEQGLALRSGAAKTRVSLVI